MGGIYEWASRADADRAYTPDRKKFVESKYGVPPVIEYLHSPVMVDNREARSASQLDVRRAYRPFKLRLANPDSLDAALARLTGGRA